MSATAVLPPSATLADARQAVLVRLRAVLSPADNAGIDRCAERLRTVLSRCPAERKPVVLVGYGGGKDSTYVLAFVRALQLRLFEQHESAFTLRAVTNRHAGMPSAVMQNIGRAYRALGLFEEPDAQLLLVDGDAVLDFAEDRPQDAAVVERNRLDILMNAHRTGADARPTFCNACNLSMVNSFGLAAAHDGGVNVIVTGDSRTEQRDYQLWVRKLARRLGTRSPSGSGFKDFLQASDVVAQAYFTDLYGEDEAAVQQRRVCSEVPDRLTFFSAYDDTNYGSGAHWELLTDFIGFRFDQLAFAFTESDCANPGLMAHLRGLKVQHVYGRSYAEGIAEYVDFAVGLMRQKEFPEVLIEQMHTRYREPAGIEHMRAMMNDYAATAFQLSEEQLVCMVHAPFREKGAGLSNYLRSVRPDLLDAADRIHRLLATDDGAAEAAELVADLNLLSGLHLEHLRTVYRGPGYPSQAGVGGNEVIRAILEGDPHKAVISTRHSASGPVVTELISGR